MSPPLVGTAAVLLLPLDKERVRLELRLILRPRILLREPRRPRRHNTLITARLHTTMHTHSSVPAAKHCHRYFGAAVTAVLN